jgi:hypothetical protein
MDNTMQPKTFWPIKQRKPENNQAKHAEELVKITQRMREVEDLFNLCSDPDLTEAYIYEMRALTARYSSVLKQARGEDFIA